MSKPDLAKINALKAKVGPGSTSPADMNSDERNEWMFVVSGAIQDCLDETTALSRPNVAGGGQVNRDCPLEALAMQKILESHGLKTRLVVCSDTSVGRDALLSLHLNVAVTMQNSRGELEEYVFDVQSKRILRAKDAWILPPGEIKKLAGTSEALFDKIIAVDKITFNDRYENMMRKWQEHGYHDVFDLREQQPADRVNKAIQQQALPQHAAA